MTMDTDNVQVNMQERCFSKNVFEHIYRFRTQCAFTSMGMVTTKLLKLNSGESIHFYIDSPLLHSQLSVFGVLFQQNRAIQQQQRLSSSKGLRVLLLCPYVLHSMQQNRRRLRYVVLSGEFLNQKHGRSGANEQRRSSFAYQLVFSAATDSFRVEPTLGANERSCTH